MENYLQNQQQKHKQVTDRIKVHSLDKEPLGYEILDLWMVQNSFYTASILGRLEIN